MKKNYIIILSAVVLGVTSLIAQVVLLRELVISFYGNELFIGLILALWLLSAGLGGIIFPVYLKNNIDRLLIGWHLVLPVFLTETFAVIRLSRIMLGSGGIIPSPGWALTASILAVVPVGLMLGAMFVVLVRAGRDRAGQAVSRIYAIESLGFFIGATVFSLVLYRLSALTAVMILAMVHFIMATVLICFKGGPVWRGRLYGRPCRSGIILLLIGFWSLLMSPVWDEQLISRQFGNESLLTTENTRFGAVAVTETAGQRNVYYNGHPVTNSQNDYHNELMVHPALLAIDDPGRVLVVGNGFSGIDREIAKHGVRTVVYIEPDREYYRLVQGRGFGAEAGTEVIFDDPRRYLKEADEPFDVVLINYANPLTLAENRFFTEDFFELLRGSMADGGVVALKLDVTPNYTFGAQNEVLGTLYRTIGSIFTNVMVLPDNEVLFLASNSALDSRADAIRQRYRELGLDNQYLTDDYLDWRLTNDRADTLTGNLENNQAAVNSDLKPSLYRQQIRSWVERMGIGFDLFRTAGWLVLLLVIVISAMFATDRPVSGIRLLITSAIPDFCLMGLEVVIVLWFQAVHGYLYTQLSLVIALILLGIAAGSRLSSRYAGKIEDRKLLRYAYVTIFFSLALPLLILWQARFLFDYIFTFYFLSLAAGFAVGTKFPVINRLYLKNSPNPGAVYGVDLVGGAMGALLAGTLMLPVLGVMGSLGVIAGLGVVSVLLVRIV